MSTYPSPVKIGLGRGAAHARAIALLSRTQIEHGLPWRWTPQRVRRVMSDAAANVAVAHLDDGRFAGFGIMSYGDEAAHLLLLAVDPALRRQGVGSALLSWLERVAVVAGVERLGLEARASNASARAFYRRHGYLEVEFVAGMYLGLDDGVRLHKPLHNATATAGDCGPAAGSSRNSGGCR